MSEALHRPTPEIPKDLQDELFAKINEWMPELTELLPDLPLDAEVSFDNRWLIEDTGTGGCAVRTKLIELAFKPDFVGDKFEQMANLKVAYFTSTIIWCKVLYITEVI